MDLSRNKKICYVSQTFTIPTKSLSEIDHHPTGWDGSTNQKDLNVYMIYFKTQDSLYIIDLKKYLKHSVIWPCRLIIIKKNKKICNF